MISVSLSPDFDPHSLLKRGFIRNGTAYAVVDYACRCEFTEDHKTPCLEGHYLCGHPFVEPLYLTVAELVEALLLDALPAPMQPGDRHALQIVEDRSDLYAPGKQLDAGN